MVPTAIKACAAGLALAGALGPTFAGGQPVSIELAQGGDDTQLLTFALETLSERAKTTGGRYHLKTAAGAAGGYTTWLELDITTHTLLKRRTDQHYYLRYDLHDGLVFTGPPSQPLVRIPYAWDHDGNSATPHATTTILIDPEARTIQADSRASRGQPQSVPDLDGAHVFQGREDQATVIYRLPRDPIPVAVTAYSRAGDVVTIADGDLDDYPVGTTFSLRVPNHLAVPVMRDVVYRASAAGYDDLSEARRASDTHGGAVFASRDGSGRFAGVGVVRLVSAVAAPVVTGQVATADARTPRDDGGPFRRFVDGRDPNLEVDDYANLATVVVALEDDPQPLHARDDMQPVTLAVFGPPAVTVTAPAGAFAVGTFRVTTSTDCSGGTGLVLGPRMDDEDLEPADATEATGDGVPGRSFFCLDVRDNETVIPRVGMAHRWEPTGYELTVTPMLRRPADVPVQARPVMSAPMYAGTIDYNAILFPITYLSDSATVNQRLVIVNRSPRPAVFLVDEFQTEAGATVFERQGDQGDQGEEHSCGRFGENDLGIRGTIPPFSRCALRVQDRIEVAPPPSRTAGTLIVAAPVDRIDVMTVQVVGGKLDTTRYDIED